MCACGATSDRYTEDQRRRQQRRVNCFRNRKLIYSSLVFRYFLSFSSQNWFTVFPTTSLARRAFFQVVTITIFHENSLCVCGSCWIPWQQIEIYEEFSGEMKMREFSSTLMRIFHFHSTQAESTLVGMEPATSDDVKVFSLFSITRV